MQGKTLISFMLAICGLVVLVMFSGPQTIRGLMAKQQFDSTNTESWREFQSFMIKYNKTYSSMEDMQKRFNIFHQNFYWIRVQNQRNLNTKYDVNHLADLTQEEFRNTYLGSKGETNRPKNYVEENIEVAEALDWVSKGAVTGIKDQKMCSSCWAFGAVASLECAYFQKNGKLIQFSEQQLVDCSQSQGNKGCNGGLADKAFDYLKENSIETTSDYPYTGKDGQCKADSSKGKCKINAYVDVKSNEADLKKALNGRVISARVDSIEWSFYSRGIFDGSCDETDLNHGVTLVGYGTENGQNFWKIKNSWGKYWGENGFLRLKRTDSSSSIGKCGIASSASYPTL